MLNNEMLAFIAIGIKFPGNGSFSDSLARLLEAFEATFASDFVPRRMENPREGIKA